jgi:uncharacterized membrane protein
VLDGVEVAGLVDQWVAEGLIDTAQAQRMHRGLEELERDGEHHARRGSVAVEALGYMGGAIVVAGSVLATARYWGSLTDGWRLALVVGTAVALLVGGAVVPSRPGTAGQRLRGVLWLSSTAAAGAALTVWASELLGLHARTTLLVVGLGMAAYAAGLWWVEHSAVQQLAMMATLGLAAAAAIHRADLSADLPGVGVWAVGVSWALLGQAGVLVPRQLAVGAGTAMAIGGAMATTGSDAGVVLTLVTVAAAVGAAIALRDLVVLAIAAAGALVNIPAAMTRWFPDSVAGPVVLIAVGLVLVGVALSILQRGHRREPLR